MSLPPGFFADLYRHAPRQLARERSDGSHAAWSGAVRTKLRELLKLDPVSTPVPFETVEVRECGDVLREKVLLRDPLFGPIPMFILKPRTVSGALPAILALHGHGGYFAGKDLVAGNSHTDPVALECTRAMNYDYGLQLAREGFLVAVPDAFNFGERLLEEDRWSQGHVCDRYLALLQAFGYSPAGVTVRGNRLVLDYLAGRSDVCGDQIGAVGLSYGGFQVLLTAVADERIRAAVISGAAWSYGAELAGKHAVCGAQIIPGAWEWFDLPDLAMSIAPRPLLFELCKQDECFDFQDACRVVDAVATVYAAIGAGARLHVDEANTGHQFCGRMVSGFFVKYLTMGVFLTLVGSGHFPSGARNTFECGASTERPGFQERDVYVNERDGQQQL